MPESQAIGLCDQDALSGIEMETKTNRNRNKK